MGGSTRSWRGSAPGRSTRAPGAWTRFSSGLAAAIVALVGIPTLLIVCATAVLDRRHPIPAIGSGEAIGEYFERGLTVTEIVPIAVRVLLVVAWLLWLAMALSIVGSVVEAATGNRRRWPHFRLFAGLSRWIAAGLTAVSSLSANFVSAGAMPSPLPFTISAVQTIDTASAMPVERAVPAGHARVLPGESAETFALRTLGDAGRWIDIWQLNQNRPVGPGGEIWTAAWKLSAGWDLRLPAGTAGTAGAAAPAEWLDGGAGIPVVPVPDGSGMATPADAAPSADTDVVPAADAEPAGSLDEVEQYRVRPGDSYWAIAEGRLGPGASGSAVAAYTEALMVHNAPRLGHPTPAMLQPGDLVSLVTPPTDVDVGVSTSGDETVDDRGEPSATGAHVHVVEAGDSYWRIAEQRAVRLHGNDGAHGTVVYGLMLDLIDLNAPRLGYDDREMLHPGDEVWLFDPALSTPSPSELAVPVAEAASAIVETATAAADVAVGAVAENAEEVAATGSSDDREPNPPESAPPPTTVEAPTSTDVPLGPAGGDASGDAAESPRRSSPSPIGLGEAALIATGIVALIAARRRARLRSAEPPARVPLPGASAAAVERELRRVSAADRLLRLDIAVRAAAATMADTASQIAAVCSSSDGSIELVTTAAVTLPEPWSGAGTRWTLAADVAVDDLAVASRTVGVPCVALTEIGVDDEGRDVLVDLEAFGVIAIDADPESSDDIVRAIATGLASSEFAEVAHLVGVGVDDAAFLDHRQAHSAGTVDEAVELAATLVGPTASAQRSTFALRSRHTGGETWEPAVILVATSAADELTPHVLRDVMSRRGVALVVGGPVVGAASTLRPAGDTWLLDPLGIKVRPVGLDRASLDDLADAVAVPAAVTVDFAPPPVASAGSVDADEAMAVGPGRVIHDLLDAGTPDSAAHVVVVDVAAGASDLALAPITIAETGNDRGSAVPGINGVTLDVPSNGNGHGPGAAGDGTGRQGNGRGPGVAECGAALNGASPSPPSPAPSGSGQASQPAASLVVRLLGPVDLIDGAGRAARFERSKTLELLAWIVTHRDRATRSGARTALWDLDVRDATFANVVSEARRVMGRHVDPPEGDEWLRRTMTDELSLHDGVVADIDIVRAALAAARGVDGSEGLALLRPAVELVRGMPFAGTSYLWPDVEGLTSNLVLLTTSVTAEYARLALDAGDVDGVFWATGQGLNVLPGQESLIGVRMRAHAERGDLSGVRVEWEAYERVLNADPWSDGEPAEKLVLLRKQLLSK
ncbi:bacterial transcriptional activator domain-containing protein [Desertimonas flava]|uniref:bacterial transcriptional activator domain-containing protein n=1 Tax=Desertimonas flava TaxID=2064846 RepID=UPI000E34D498|nr:bacterial transcriptional activator domain-containing protein [Desertimonas flava]